MCKEDLKQQILKVLERSSHPITASTILVELKYDGNNQNLVLSSKKIGSACGELTREGKLIKEYKIPNQLYGFYSLTSVWLKQTEKWIRTKIPLQFPDVKVRMEIVEEPNMLLDGRTRIKKKMNVSTYDIDVRIRVSKNLLRKKNISSAIKMIIVHELCHVVSPKNPDLVMKRYFPLIWSVWSKAQNEKALECSYELKKLE